MTTQTTSSSTGTASEPQRLVRNIFLGKDGHNVATTIGLTRYASEEKVHQIDNVKYFRIALDALATHDLKLLQDRSRERKNIFAALIQAVKMHSLGRLSHPLYDVGREYRLNM